MSTDEFLKNDAFLTTELLKLAVESAGIGVWRVNPQTRGVELSAALKQMLGIPVEQAVDYATFLALLHPEDKERTRRELAAALTSVEGKCELEFRIIAPPNGVGQGDNIRWMSASGRVFFEGETRKPTLFIGTIRDVTEAKAALEQQQMLLHEVNHRVKNSLQLVSSLLRLQARRIPDLAARRQLEDATTRISTIAHIHQRLYRDQDIQRINFGAFLSELCADLQGSAPQCSLDVRAPDFRVTTDRAIPLALVVNELVTNAFKYAYPALNGEVAGGRVAVSVDLLDAGEIAITVQDDGVGLPEDFTIAGGSNLGMLLIGSLLAQLSGKLDVRPGGGGTCFVVTAPID
ncbi:MAG: domain S-box protein [Rhodospirillales bacterium]|nr:domain S-box protein [Rhodospirillales bacterium]